MKKILLLSVLMSAILPNTIMAQDDMYFVPTKKDMQKAEQERKKKKEDKAYQYAYPSGGLAVNTDEYNRHPNVARDYSKDSLYNDVIDFSVGNGIYADTLTQTDQVMASMTENDDYYYCRQLSRFDDFYLWHSPLFYGPGFTHRPYGWYAGWYDPWYYDPFFFDPWFSYGPGWYGGYYRNWYGYSGYYNWYSPWMYGYDPYWFHGYYYEPIFVIHGGGHKPENGFDRHYTYAGSHNHHYTPRGGTSNHSSYDISVRNGGDAKRIVNSEYITRRNASWNSDGAFRQNTSHTYNNYESHNNYSTPSRSTGFTGGGSAGGHSGGASSGGYSGGGHSRGGHR